MAPFKSFRLKILLKSISNPKLIATSVGIVLILLSAFFINLRHQYSKQQHEIEMSLHLNTVQKNLEYTLKASYNSNLAIGTTINDQGVPENFETVAANIIRLYPIIDAIELVPNGVIKYIYPLEKNKKAYNFDILNTSKSPLISQEAQIALQRKSIYFAGPLELKQGGTAIIGRYPIFLKNKFWGFSAVVIRFDDLMKASGIYSFKNPKYYYQFSKINPVTKKEEFFLSQSSDLENKIYKKVNIPDGNWNLYIIDKKSDHFYLNDLLPYLMISVLLTLIIPYLIYTILKKPQELVLINSLQEKEIQRTNAKFKLIFNKTSIAIAQINSESRKMMEVNPQFCKLISRDASKLIEKSFLDFVHPEDINLLNESLNTKNSFLTQSHSITIRLKNTQNDYIWTRIVSLPLMEEDVNEKPIILIIDNVTERKIAEEKLIQSELQFKTLFRESPIALWEEDGSEVLIELKKLNLIGENREKTRIFLNQNPNLLIEFISKIKILNANQECLKLYNANTLEELKSSFVNTMNNSPKDSFKEMILEMCQGLTQGRIQSKIHLSDGNTKHIAMTWNVVDGYEENYGKIIISTIDITEQINSQKLIINSEQRLQSLINSIEGIVWECSPQTYEFQFVSAKAKQILGYETSEWLEKKDFWKSKIYEEDRDWVIKFCRENVQTSNYFSFEYRMIAQNGSVLWFRDIVNVERNEGKPVLLRGIMIDISVQKENEAVINKSLNMVTEQNKRLLNFSYIVSHNLRSHTANIQSLAIHIKESKNPKEKQKLIHLIETVSNDLNDTIINLNEVINIRKNVNLNVENLKLVTFVLKSLDSLSESIREKNIKILGKIPPQATLVYNRAYLQSVLINIISNAVRYCKKTDENRYIKFNYYQEEEFSILEIEDNGIGINMQRHKDKIFGLYKTFSNNKDATGIGLFITKNQVEAMGGKIEIQSELNKGSTVRIYFKN